ncbi:MAG: GrpB family protein [Treponema sp.]|nr:GrpB family protein [Treponema sp.]
MAIRNIVVLPYDAKWKQAFENIKKEVQDALGELALELKRHLSFRDYLRTHPVAVEEYSKIKLEAAQLFPHDIDAYINHKSSVIEKVYKEIGLI